MPVPNPLRFFDTNGNACFVPTTDGPCYTGCDSTHQPGVRLPSQSQCYDGYTVNSRPRPAGYNSTRQPGYLATNGYTLGNSTNGSNPGDIDHLAQLKTSYEGALEKLLTTNTSAPSAPSVPWFVPAASAASWAMPGDEKTRFEFAIHDEESRCKLAIECKVAQLAVEKGVEVSDGTVYSEFLEQIRSQPNVARAVKQAQKSLPHDVFASIEAMFSGAGRKDDVFESIEAMPMFSGVSREDADASNVITLASGAIREGADKADSSGTSQKGAVKPITTPAVPFLAFPSDSSQSFKLSNLHFSGGEEDSRAVYFPSSPRMELPPSVSPPSLSSSEPAHLRSSIARVQSSERAASGGADEQRFKLSDLDWGSDDDEGYDDWCSRTGLPGWQSDPSMQWG